MAEAARFETPLRWVAGAAAPHSWFAVDDPNLVLDTVKRAEDSDALVLRLYEAHGARGVARVRVGLPFRGAELCNLLEDPGAELRVGDGADRAALPAPPDPERAAEVNNWCQAPIHLHPDGVA